MKTKPTKHLSCQLLDMVLNTAYKGNVDKLTNRINNIQGTVLKSNTIKRYANGYTHSLPQKTIDAMLKLITIKLNK